MGKTRNETARKSAFSVMSTDSLKPVTKSHTARTGLLLLLRTIKRNRTTIKRTYRLTSHQRTLSFSRWQRSKISLDVEFLVKRAA